MRLGDLPPPPTGYERLKLGRAVFNGSVGQPQISWILATHDLPPCLSTIDAAVKVVVVI